MSSHHDVVNALLIDARIKKTRRTGRSYEIRYTFTLPPSRETFTHGDETGRADLWASLANEATWNEARQTKRVRVIYRHDDPWVNRPEQAGGMPLGDLGFQLRGRRLIATAVSRPER